MPNADQCQCEGPFARAVVKPYGGTEKSSGLVMDENLALNMISLMLAACKSDGIYPKHTKRLIARFFIYVESGKVVLGLSWNLIVLQQTLGQKNERRKSNDSRTFYKCIW